MSASNLDDVKRQLSDVIFIPAVGATVTTDGEAQCPATYEARGKETISDPSQAAITLIRAMG